MFWAIGALMNETCLIQFGRIAFANETDMGMQVRVKRALQIVLRAKPVGNVLFFVRMSSLVVAQRLPY